MTRRLTAEGLGTAFLLYVIVGSGITAEALGTDAAIQLLAHGLVVGLGLGALITLFQIVSGSHFNPSVTLALWRSRTLNGAQSALYILVQVLGALLGVVAANLTFAQSIASISSTDRSGLGLLASELISTFILVLLVLSLTRTGRPNSVPVAVGAWVAAMVFASSSTGFANPAATIARIFTDTYTGLAPASAGRFLVAQLIAGIAASPIAIYLYPGNAPQGPA